MADTDVPGPRPGRGAGRVAYAARHRQLRPAAVGRIPFDGLPRHPGARRLLGGTLASALGHGLTLPFLFIYLTEIRHLAPSTVGLVIGWLGLVSLAAAPVGGILVDRFGARPVALPMLLVEAVGVGSLALVSGPVYAFASATLVGSGVAVIVSAINTMLTSMTTDDERERVFGLQFMLLNAGLGAGALISGTIVDATRPGTFQLLYVMDAACYLIPLLVLISVRDVRLRPAAGDPDRGGAAPGYRAVLRDRAFRRLMLFSIVLTISGYAQIEIGFTAFAVRVAHVTPRVVGYAFAANTLVIVLAQFFVIRLIAGRSRSRVLAYAAAIMAVSWLTLGAAGIADGRHAAISSVLVIACATIFACGETLLSPVSPAVLNALATDELRGRYNALGAMVWGISGIAAPISAAGLLGSGLGGLWIALVVGGCLVASLLAASMRRMLTTDQDGRHQGRHSLL